MTCKPGKSFQQQVSGQPASGSTVPKNPGQKRRKRCVGLCGCSTWGCTHLKEDAGKSASSTEIPAGTCPGAGTHSLPQKGEFFKFPTSVWGGFGIVPRDFCLFYCSRNLEKWFLRLVPPSCICQLLPSRWCFLQKNPVLVHLHGHSWP